MARPHTPVPPQTVARLRALCLALPGVIEEAAWIGTRWRVGQKTFAHVLMIDAGLPAAYARVAHLSASDGATCVLTFRSPLPELDVFAFAKAPFFRPGWWPDIVGLFIDDDTDWDDVDALIADSWRHLAPKRLRDAC